MFAEPKVCELLVMQVAVVDYNPKYTFNVKRQYSFLHIFYKDK